METWKHPSSYGGFSPDGDYCVLSRNRDSAVLDESNWAVACKTLGAEAHDSGEMDDRPAVYHWRAGHWACGWVEYLMVRADAPQETIDAAQEIVDSLEGYPVLDDDHYSNAEYEAAAAWWDRESVRTRAGWCAEAGVSIFAARNRGGMPAEVYDQLREHL